MFLNILPCIISMSSISLFAMFVVDSMLYVIVGSTTFLSTTDQMGEFDLAIKYMMMYP